MKSICGREVLHEYIDARVAEGESMYCPFCHYEQKHQEAVRKQRLAKQHEKFLDRAIWKPLKQSPTTTPPSVTTTPPKSKPIPPKQIPKKKKPKKEPLATRTVIWKKGDDNRQGRNSHWLDGMDYTVVASSKNKSNLIIGHETPLKEGPTTPYGERLASLGQGIVTDALGGGRRSRFYERRYWQVFCRPGYRLNFHHGEIR